MLVVEVMTAVCLHINKQEALLSQRGRAMLRVCIASIQNVEHSLLLLVTHEFLMRKADSY